MADSTVKVRFIKFIEEVHNGDIVELKKAWIIITDKFTALETLWTIMHKTWHIENNVFHQLKSEGHLEHCFLHSPTGVEAVVMFLIIAFNLMQLYFFRCMRPFREKRMFQIIYFEYHFFKR